MSGQSVPIALSRPQTNRERLIVALDVPEATEALALVDRLGDEVLWYKVGMELFYGEGIGASRIGAERQASGSRRRLHGGRAS